MPIGYFVSVLPIAVCTAVALHPPRPGHSRPVSVAFWFAVVVNEIPVLAIEYLVASTLLALSEGDLSSPGGIVGAGFAAVTVLGLIVLTRRGLRSASKLRSDVTPVIGPLPNERHRLRALQWPLPTRARGVERLRDIAYGNGRNERLDLYRSGDRRGPTLVYFHGGAFRSGDKGRQARPLMQSLAQRGWVCISANYPLAPHARYRDQLAAARAVVAWARSAGASYGADPDRVLLAGSSAGAHLAATIALTDPTVRAAICLGGYFGFADDEDPQSSPTVHFTKDRPAFLVVHGDHDTITVINDARDFVERLRTTSERAVVYAELAGAEHSFDVFHSPRMDAVIDASHAFGRFSTR